MFDSNKSAHFVHFAVVCGRSFAAKHLCESLNIYLWEEFNTFSEACIVEVFSLRKILNDIRYCDTPVSECLSFVIVRNIYLFLVFKARHYMQPPRLLPPLRSAPPSCRLSWPARLTIPGGLVVFTFTFYNFQKKLLLLSFLSFSY